MTKSIKAAEQKRTKGIIKEQNDTGTILRHERRSKTHKKNNKQAGKRN